MYSPQSETFINRVTKALSLPMRARCAELTVLFDRGTSLELQTIFPIVIDSIFGPFGSISWGLRTITDGNSDFRQLEHFLSPCGPFFKLIYALLKDPSAKYEFPVDLLPSKIRTMDNFNIHPFYSDLVRENMQTKNIISLRLNPFDFYIFHFAYHLVNPWHQRGGPLTASSNCWNTVYFLLCCEYMVHFLPTDPGSKILPLIMYNGKNPISTIPQVEKSTSMTSLLINKNILSKSLDEYANNQEFLRHPRMYTWRSETVLNVFIDMWLGSDHINQKNNPMNNSMNNASHFQHFLQFTELPTSEYMRIVRVLIKQIHSFSASAKADDTDLCELKKISLRIVQGKFYVFVRNLIQRWPLDGSFRLLLELWLTYLQPWRYPPTISANKKLVDQEDDEKSVTGPSRDHLQFIAENLLVYVVIFQQLLPRFIRVDLVSPKMAVMLFRISKVFNQTNLPSLLREIENSIDQNPSPRSYVQMSALSPTSNWGSNQSENPISLNESHSHSATNLNERKWNAIVRQKIYELEGPLFTYRPLLATSVNNSKEEVHDLLRHIKRSIKVAEEVAKAKKAEEDEIYSSFRGLFSSLWKAPKMADEFSLNERVKVPEYLSRSLNNLTELFGVTQLPEVETMDVSTSVGHSTSFDPRTDFRFLTPAVVRERMKKLKYDGDPDLHPIRTNEVAFLVRMLYDISRNINEKFCHEIHDLYYDQSYRGRLTRQLLSPPMTVYKYDSNVLGSPRVAVNLPPRVSLRPLAGYKFLTYFLLFGLISYMCGYGVFFYVFWTICLWMVYVAVKAVFSQPVRHNYPTEGFRNISFDDSF